MDNTEPFAPAESQPEAEFCLAGYETASHLAAESRLLTQQQAAEKLQVDVRTLIRLQNDGTVPFIQLGKLVRFCWPRVLAHLNAHFTVINRQGAKDAKAK